MITRAEDFFDRGCGRCARFDTPDCSVHGWGAGLKTLRTLCLSAGLTETVKWGHPCYMAHGRNIALIGAFRGDFRLTLMNAALLDDPLHLLDRISPQSRQPEVIRFTDPAQVGTRAPGITALLEQSMAHAKAGRRPPRATRPLALPPELETALAEDPELSAAFAALTPGRQRSYALNLAAAKRPETRIARIAKFRPAILAGKGATER